MSVSKLMNKFEGELNRLGVKHSITKKQQKEIIESFFDDLKMMITDPRMPKVRINNFGTFSPCRGQISRTLWKTFWWRNIGQGSLKEFRKRISWLWPIRQRLLKEEKIKGERREKYKHNYVFWHKKNYKWSELKLLESSKELFGKYFYEERDSSK